MDYSFLNVIDEKREELQETADYIWENPELAFTEYKSAAALEALLEKEGFQVEKGLAGIETAFSGRFGSGSPVIGFLGEFDALSGLRQTADTAEQDAAAGGPGHGCGHNLLGIGSLAAAIGLKNYLEERKCAGTVIYFGCPGEEGGSGKAFMARDHVFDGLDAAFCWHPSDVTGVSYARNLGNAQLLFKFTGKAAHASASPDEGRSALDALELMNVGVNFLREHMPLTARVHYAITDTGGISPNVVQAHAEALYLVRAADNKQVKQLTERVINIARGAALMTDTNMEYVFIKACSNMIRNDVLRELLQEKLEALPLPAPSAEDLAFGREMAEKALTDFREADPQEPYEMKIQRLRPQKIGKGSSDVADVSWNCPTGEVRVRTACKGTPLHSWQMTAQGKRALAKDSTLYVGKVLAAAAAELIEHPERLEAAKEEHKKNVGPEGYVPPIPAGVVPTPMEAFIRKG